MPTRISKELYHDSTHFLHELVQNADDNQYGGCTPTLRVQYNNRHLLLLSNEMGFCKKNVDAICSVGRSSKRAEQTIGEKGVGFKSVFRAADKVWITSGHYSFSFDSSRRLGIITPRREPFPQPAFAKHGHTAMCLRLAKNYDSMELVDAIKKLDPRLLMFLRKLRCLELSVTEESGHSWSSRLQREEATFGGGLEYCNLLRDGTCQRYVLARHQVTGLDSASRRLPCTESELVLAFAISEDARPLPSPQEVHAFLPIRDCGLKVLCRASAPSSSHLLTAVSLPLSSCSMETSSSPQVAKILTFPAAGISPFSMPFPTLSCLLFSGSTRAPWHTDGLNSFAKQRL